MLILAVHRMASTPKRCWRACCTSCRASSELERTLAAGGRNAYAFLSDGHLKLRNARHRLADGPLEEGCTCYTCGRFSRGYLRHLFLAAEMLGPILTSIHNLHLYQRLMKRIRELIPLGKTHTISDEFPVVDATR